MMADIDFFVRKADRIAEMTRQVDELLDGYREMNGRLEEIERRVRAMRGLETVGNDTQPA